MLALSTVVPRYDSQTEHIPPLEKNGPRTLQHAETRYLDNGQLVTTVVGVCMLMKHDGMDLQGFAGFVFKGYDLPYPLCPLLGECLHYNSTARARIMCEPFTDPDFQEVW